MLLGGECSCGSNETSLNDSVTERELNDVAVDRLRSSSVLLSPPSDSSQCSVELETNTMPALATCRCITGDSSLLVLQDHFQSCCCFNAAMSCTSNGVTESAKVKASLIIPQGTKLLEHQVGGHLYRNGKVGFLADAEPGIVLKPIQSFPRGMIECAFYSKVFAPDCVDPVLTSLSQFMPRYHGVVHIPENGINYMRLEDVTTLVEAPAAVMDVKMGRHTWDPRSTPEKRKRADNKYPYAAEIGFQITGFRTTSEDNGDGSKTQHYYSDYTRSITPDQLIPKAFRVFFGGKVLRRACVERTVERLQQIGDWFRSQRSFCFYSSSLLLVHSTEQRNGIAKECQQPNQGFAEVRLVDFAHVYPANGELDENFLHGLDTLVVYLKRLLDENDQ